MNETLAKWKEWWSQLAMREKQAVVLGASLLTIFIVYEWIWTPYLNHVNHMREQISTDQKLLVWMQQTDQAINKIESQSKNKTRAVSPVELLSLMKKQVNQAGLEQYLTQLREAANESVEMNFQKVGFDKLIHLLTQTIKEQHITILQMSVIAGNTPGIVNADVMVKSG